MKKTIISAVLLLLTLGSAKGQFWKMKRIEVSAGPGLTQFSGDIGGFSKGKNALGLKDFSFRQTSFSINLNGRYRVLNNVSARLDLNIGSFHSTDSRGSNENRGLESKTSFNEVAILGEYYFIKNKTENSFLMMKGRRKPLLSFVELMDCYAFTGIGGLSYKVYPNSVLAEMNSGLDGFTVVIPLGAGISFHYSPQFDFGIELGSRFPFSDNIDGYTSQYSRSNDFYLLFNVNAIYKINTGKSGRR
jgi:hypothetical protein